MLSYTQINAKILRVRERLAGIIAAKTSEPVNGKTIHELLAMLSAYTFIKNSDVIPEGERQESTTLTLLAPTDLSLYTGGSDPDTHVWTETDNLVIKVYRGSTLISENCKGFDGEDFVYDALNYLCAGNRVQIYAGTEKGILTVQWIHQGSGAIMLTEEYSFDGFKTPVYFRCPSGSNLQLKINGNTVPLEVQTQGVWLDAPQGGLSSTYAGCPVRTKNNAGDGGIACWTDNGYDSDYFWYLT